MEKLNAGVFLLLAFSAALGVAGESDPSATPVGASVHNFRVAQGAPVPISVVHAATFQDFAPDFPLSSNTFGTIFAEVATAPAQGAGRLLPDVPLNIWSEEFVDGVAPTALDDVSIMINGRPAFISFIGRAELLGSNLDQINFISPDDDAVGPVSIEVFQGETMVAASTVDLGPISPGLFVFPGATAEVAFAAGLTFPDALFLAPDGFFGEGLASRAAASDEVIQVFGSGFGATEPAVPAGQLAPAAPADMIGRIPNEEITATIGGLPAPVFFGGLAPFFAGLYQFNMRVPQLPDGNHLIVIRRNGIASQDGLSIPVLNQP